MTLLELVQAVIREDPAPSELQTLAYWPRQRLVQHLTQIRAAVPEPVSVAAPGACIYCLHAGGVMVPSQLAAPYTVYPGIQMMCADSASCRHRIHDLFHGTYPAPECDWCPTVPGPPPAGKFYHSTVARQQLAGIPAVPASLARRFIRAVTAPARYLRRRYVGPLFAFEAILVAFAGMREMKAAAAAQREELDGAAANDRPYRYTGVASGCQNTFMVREATIRKAR